MQAEKAGIKSSSGSSHYSSGFGNSASSYTAQFSASSDHVSTSSYDMSSSNSGGFSSASISGGAGSSANKPNKAMKLGTNKDILPAFIEQQMKQAMPSHQAAASSSSAQTAALDSSRPSQER